MATRKNYYDEKYVYDMLIEYQGLVETVEDEKGHKIVVNKTYKIEQLENAITVEVLKVVRAIIFYYGYQKYMDYQELEAIGIQACFQNYLKFDPTLGFSSFNFFSIIVKKCLYGTTTRNSKKRRKIVYMEDLGDAIHSSVPPDVDRLAENLKATLIDIVDSNFVGKKRLKYKQIAEVICDYIKKTKAYISKTDMYRFCGSYSFRASDVREFLQAIRDYNPEIFSLVENTKENTDGIVDPGDESDE